VSINLLAPLAWLTIVFGLFIGFTVMAAMWRSAEAENRNGWVIALVWATAAMLAIRCTQSLSEAFALARC